VLGHVAFAGITHEPAAALARDLVAVAPPGLSRVFFSDDGSTAVEAALKLAVQYFAQTGRPGKHRFVALEGAFHGDTTGAVSLGGVEVFRRRFGPLTFEALHVPSPAPSLSLPPPSLGLLSSPPLVSLLFPSFVFPYFSHIF
jgi:adenosylmethionine-8-amino-7-oxononanoate aminotransferase